MRNDHAPDRPRSSARNHEVVWLCGMTVENISLAFPAPGQTRTQFQGSQIPGGT